LQLWTRTFGVILLAHRLECQLTLLRIDGDRFRQPEGEQRLRGHYRRPARSEQNARDRRSSARSGSDSGPRSAVYRTADRRAQAGCSGYRCGIASLGRTSRSLYQLRLHRQLVPIY
jgi:hypothetical protein